MVFSIGKHADRRLQEMGKALGVDTQTLISFLLEKMVGRLEKQPDILPWVSKLFLEVGEPEVHLAHADLRSCVYYRLTEVCRNRQLALDYLAAMLVAALAPFWGYKGAIGLTGRAQQEELTRGLRIDLALGFAKL